MKRFSFTILSALFPLLAFASTPGSINNNTSNLTFSPPPSDLSVVFLGNIFGIVDGVLSGTGSQIMGNMFGVFNSAVLALGGIIIMYTLLVSTMNTAHEGQMLGQKWSSIWVPMRSTLGLALLIPKGSGYCLMQIFVMWVVVQGIGAADKIWAAALSYLNRGGVIVQTQSTAATSLLGNGGQAEVVSGATTILAGQVCMAGLQSILELNRQNFLNSKQNNSGPCSGTPSAAMQTFCSNAVPDFMSTVNTVSIENAGNPPSSGSYTVSMPNFPNNSPYYALNDICGSIQWQPFNTTSGYGTNSTGTVTSNSNPNSPSISSAFGATLSSAELSTVKMSRAIAIQQMYVDLSAVAQAMVNNAPAFQGQQTTNSNNQTPVSFAAQQQYGVPFTNAGAVCVSSGSNCVSWGQDSSFPSAPLFSGSEFQGAVTDYNGIMLPTLNLALEANNSAQATQSRQFIQKSNQEGWITAGSYFFNLAQLNAPTAGGSNASLTDSNTGLNGSKFSTNTLTSAFNNGQCVGPYAPLCQWLNGDISKVNDLMGLINAQGIGAINTNNTSSPTVPTPAVGSSTTTTYAYIGQGASTVYGFINNSIMVNLPGQPGLQGPVFALKFNISFDPGPFTLPEQDFECGNVKIMFFNFCLGQLLGDIFYNDMIRYILNFFMDLLEQFVNMVVISLLSVPLLGIAQIFQQGISIIQQPTVNPVVALANMGVNYINFANEVWIYALVISENPVGFILAPLLALIFPLLATWLSIMLMIGFTTAYYIPFLPYMIFTFGAIAWLISVIEAMVAAPLVALGVTHPEGHEAFGKGEHAIMLILNVFLRPAMMIIGFIAGITLSYVGVWIINAGFANTLVFLQGNPNAPTWNYNFSGVPAAAGAGSTQASQLANEVGSGYTGWAGIYGFFFSVLIYTTMYLTVVQKSFTLISYLPDKVLRWIGGTPDSLGADSSQWGDEVKGKVGEGAKDTAKAAGTIDAKLTGYSKQGIEKAKQGFSGAGPNVTASGGDGGGGGGGGDSGGGGGGGGSPPGGGGGMAGGGGGMAGGGGGGMPPIPPV